MAQRSAILKSKTMPKTKRNYQNFIGFNSSDKFIMAIEAARRSKSAIEKFGVIPSKTEFIRGVIYNWINKYESEILELNGEIPEVTEHKNLKEDEKRKLNDIKKFADVHFKNRKK